MSDLQTDKETKIRRRIDQYGKAGLIMVAISALPDLYYMLWANVAVVGLTVLFFIFCIYLNSLKNKYYKVSGTLLSIGANAVVLYASLIFGDLSRAYLFYIPIFIATFLITNYRNTLELAFNIGHIIVGIFVIDMFDMSFLQDKSLTHDALLSFGRFNTVLALSASVYFLIAFVNEIAENEDNLHKVKEQLKEQNEELQKKNEELDRLIYSISHDIKAPLASLSGLTYIAKLESTQPELHVYFDRMDTSIKRLRNFLDNVINYYKNSKFNLKPELMDFDLEVQGILESLSFAPNFHQIVFNVNIDQKYPFYSDKLRIQTVLVNLVSNAIKYQNEENPNKKIDITIQTFEDEVKIEVADNGIGIPNNIQDKIFQMFYRGTVKSDGSGLGLYILSETVKKLNGRIKLESVPDLFTKFIVYVPSVLHE